MGSPPTRRTLSLGTGQGETLSLDLAMLSTVSAMDSFDSPFKLSTSKLTTAQGDKLVGSFCTEQSEQREELSLSSYHSVRFTAYYGLGAHEENHIPPNFNYNGSPHYGLGAL